MSKPDKNFRKRVRTAKLTLWMAERGSYNKTPLDKFCRWLVNRVTTLEPDDDWMRDSYIDCDQGFDPAELDQYQNGKGLW